jgi:cytidine deaminase
MSVLVDTEVMTEELQRLAKHAWEVRKSARILGATPVGCAVLGANGDIATGCNIEHRFRSHDIHAEVNAIGTLVATGEHRVVAVVVAAERDRFSPCGSCMDWIFEFGGAECVVAWQPSPERQLVVLTAGDLMPYYPQ